MSKNTTLPSCGNITDVTWSEGEHNVTVWANDTLDNLNWNTITFRLDTTEPETLITDPSNKANVTDNTIDVNYSRTDSGTGMNTCWYSNDSMSKNTTLPSCGNITDVTWIQGQHDVTIWTNDSLDNLN